MMTEIICAQYQEGRLANVVPSQRKTTSLLHLRLQASSFKFHIQIIFRPKVRQAILLRGKVIAANDKTVDASVCSGPSDGRVISSTSILGSVVFSQTSVPRGGPECLSYA